MAFVSLAVFGGYYCWKTAPIFFVFAALILIIGLGYLQNRAQFDDFNVEFYTSKLLLNHLSTSCLMVA